MFDRWYAGTLQEKLARPYVHLVFGARQTGKSTLLRALLPPETLVFDLADPKAGETWLCRLSMFPPVTNPRPDHGPAVVLPMTILGRGDVGYKALSETLSAAPFIGRGSSAARPQGAEALAQ